MRPTSARRATTALVASLTSACLFAAILFGGPAVAEPSEAELAKQEQEAAKLKDVAEEKVATTEAAAQRLVELAKKASHALEIYAVANTEAQAARDVQRAEQGRHDAAVQVADEQRAVLGRFAAAAYRNGASSGQVALLTSLLSAQTPTQVGRTAADLQWVGTQQSAALERMRAAELRAAQAAVAADAAAERAGAAENRAREANDLAEALVAEQQALVTQLDGEADAALDAAKIARKKAAQMAKAILIAAQYRAEAERQRRAAIGRGEVVLDLVDGSCPGGDVSQFPNGQIDRSYLCPLWGAEWHALRADAAATFNRMSKAYAEQFGRPICVTDSYRSLELQIDVHKRKPNMTAIPGTSNHGWGTAVDLCDGVENFGTPAFRWLQANAPRFHWYHPGWAAQGGSRPEPWHWEFAG